jgi:hypothetical protein
VRLDCDGERDTEYSNTRHTRQASAKSISQGSVGYMTRLVTLSEMDWNFFAKVLKHVPSTKKTDADWREIIGSSHYG